MLFIYLFINLFIRSEQVNVSSPRASNPWLELEKAAFARRGRSSDQFSLIPQAKNRLSSDPPLTKTGRRLDFKVRTPLKPTPTSYAAAVPIESAQLTAAQQIPCGKLYRCSRHSWSGSSRPTPCAPDVFQTFCQGR